MKRGRNNGWEKKIKSVEERREEQRMEGEGKRGINNGRKEKRKREVDR